MPDAVAENKAQETLLGSGNLISSSLEKQAGQVVLAGDLVAALVLGAMEGFQEPPLLQPVPGCWIWPWWHVTRGCTSWCTGFITPKGDRLAGRML